MTSKIYVITVENPLSEEVKLRAAYSRKLEAMTAFKRLEKTLTDKNNPLGYNLVISESYPNRDAEFVPSKTLISVGI